MRTIVINTSKEAINTKLDVLFKAPFDQSNLLWYDSNLTNLDAVAQKIKQTLINDADTVDRDYNMIVLVDLYDFPHGNEMDTTKLYKALLIRYIGVMLVNKLHSEFNLTPMGVSVYFVDSAKYQNYFSLETLTSNPLEQERIANEALSGKENLQIETNAGGDLVDNVPMVKKKSHVDRSREERLIMELFSWTEETNQDAFQWMLKASISEEIYLDFSKTFEEAAVSIQNSHKSAKVLEIALESVVAILSDIEEGNWNEIAVARLPVITSKDYSIYSLTCACKRDNEQSLVESYFSVFANIFSCVQSGQLHKTLTLYEKDSIKQLLIDALKKYQYFSDEKNIDVDFEAIGPIFELRERVYKSRRENAQKQNAYKDKTAEEVADIIMQTTNTNDSTNEVVSGGAKLHGLDRAFYTLVDEVFANYDPEKVKKQNDTIVKSCLKGLWNWRDEQTSEAFKKEVELVLTNAGKNGEKAGTQTASEASRADIAFIKEEYEREYTELINAVTEAEHKLVENQNILLETKDLILKYGDLMRKGKWYLISFIGAIIAVITSVFPYIYMQSYSTNETVIHRVLYGLFIVGFVLLYSVASGIYIGKINKKKRLLKEELEQLKVKSEEERRASIAALYTYYTQTIIDTESHCLLWRELLRRDRENSKKGIKRNNHKKRLEMLAGAVKRFMTMLKFSVEDEACENTAADEKKYEELGLRLNSDASFYSADNQKVYSILLEKSLPEKSETKKEGGEEAQ